MMAAAVNMPKLGLQMSSGLITKWLVSEGDIVKKGDPLFSIETDKIVSDVESTASGTVLKIVVKEGEEAEITAPCCYVGKPGESVIEAMADKKEAASAPVKMLHRAEDSKGETAAQKEGRIFATPYAKKLSKDLGIDITSVRGSGPNGRIQKNDILGWQENSRIRITPAAKKLAQEYRIDFTAVPGSGPGGRIQKADMMAFYQSKKTESPVAAEPVPDTEGVRKPMSSMRRTVARRLSESKQTIPHVYFRDEVDASGLIAARDMFKEAALRKNGNKLTYNDIILKAVALTLSGFEDINAQLDGDSIIYFKHVHLGFAVSVPNGLMVPVIRNAEEKSVAEISREASTLVGKARMGKLMPDEFTGGTFTVSNLGGYGLESFQAIINPPESGILAIGSIHKKAVVIGDEMMIRPMMSIVGSFDHRLVDGALAARFMAGLKKILEETPALFI